MISDLVPAFKKKEASHDVITLHDFLGPSLYRLKSAKIRVTRDIHNDFYKATAHLVPVIYDRSLADWRLKQIPDSPGVFEGAFDQVHRQPTAFHELFVIDPQHSSGPEAFSVFPRYTVRLASKFLEKLFFKSLKKSDPIDASHASSSLLSPPSYADTFRKRSA